MTSPASGAFRGARAAVLGVVCVALALTGHLAGGGRAPSPWALLILGVPTGAVALALTARRRGLPTIGATVALTQLSLHEALMWLTAGSGCSVTGDPHAHLGHGSAAPVLDCAAMAGMGTRPGAAHFSLGAMVLGHAVAGLLTTLVLAYGESLLWRMCTRLVRRPLVPCTPLVAIGQPALARPPAMPRPRVVAGPNRRRGPPVAALVVG